MEDIQKIFIVLQSRLTSKTIPYFYWKILCKYLWKKMKKIFITDIQYIIFWDLQINIDNKNSPRLFFDILHCTTIIYENICTGFSLGEEIPQGNFSRSPEETYIFCCDFLGFQIMTNLVIFFHTSKIPGMPTIWYIL